MLPRANDKAIRSATEHPSRYLHLTIFTLLFLLPLSLAAATITQTLTLDYGWNAVWLEVAPVDADGNAQTSEQVFQSADFIVDQVGSPVGRLGTAEFTADPQTLFNQGGWDVWTLTSPSAQSGVVPVRGNHPYLVHISPNAGVSAADGDPAGSLAVTGEVRFYAPEWEKGDFNLVGFGVSGTPTFDAFFAGSGLVIDATLGTDALVQRLDTASGAWVAVDGTDAIESGEAYWVNVPYDLPGAGWNGPVATEFRGASSGTWYFGAGPGSLSVVDPAAPTAPPTLFSPGELTFSNLDNDAADSAAVTLTRLTPAATDPAANDLLFSALEPVPAQLQWQTQSVDFYTGWAATSLGAGASSTVTVGVQRNWTTGLDYREQLYRVDAALVGGGTAYRYLPVIATNPNLPADASDTPAATTFAGLWVGQITLRAVTSLTSEGLPLQETPSELPMRLYVHVDATGQARLLTRGILMRTKTASPEVESTTVLVVDETKIPYFEGLRERLDGGRIGLRIETPAFDLPRDLGTAASLRAEVAAAEGIADAASVTDEEILAYLRTTSSRPPGLPEVYYLSWDLEGELGVGHTLATAAEAPLVLDPYHRSNPFLHVFHPQHRVGYTITRALSIAFDAAPDPAVLLGTYEETTRGLARQAIVSKGVVELRRVSTVDTLQ